MDESVVEIFVSFSLRTAVLSVVVDRGVLALPPDFAGSIVFVLVFDLLFLVLGVLPLFIVVDVLALVVFVVFFFLFLLLVLVSLLFLFIIRVLFIFWSNVSDVSIFCSTKNPSSEVNAVPASV